MNACKLIRNYLSCRRQCVKVQNTLGEQQYIERGVPQGSLAGPLLFNIFINDFMYLLENKCSVYNYADDNTLSKHHRDPLIVKSSLEDCANLSIHWFSENNMKANPDKFQAMVLCRRDVNICFTVGDITIVPTNCVKLLGVIIDNKLSFHEHVKHLCKKAGRQVSALTRLTNVLSEESKKIVFNSFIVSNFNYCPLVYHICGKVSSLDMERIQLRGLRLVHNDFTSDHATLRQKANVSTLFISRLRSLCMYVYKVVHNIVPNGSCVSFNLKETPYTFRNNMILNQEAFSTVTYGYNALSYLGAKAWNMLPNDFKCMPLNEFKQCILKWDGLSCCGKCHLCFITV